MLAPWERSLYKRGDRRSALYVDRWIPCATISGCAVSCLNLDEIGQRWLRPGATVFLQNVRGVCVEIRRWAVERGCFHRPGPLRELPQITYRILTTTIDVCPRIVRKVEDTCCETRGNE